MRFSPTFASSRVWNGNFYVQSLIMKQSSFSLPRKCGCCCTGTPVKPGVQDRSPILILSTSRKPVNVSLMLRDSCILNRYLDAERISSPTLISFQLESYRSETAFLPQSQARLNRDFFKIVLTAVLLPAHWYCNVGLVHAVTTRRTAMTPQIVMKYTRMRSLRPRSYVCSLNG